MKKRGREKRKGKNHTLDGLLIIISVLSPEMKQRNSGLEEQNQNIIAPLIQTLLN